MTNCPLTHLEMAKHFRKRLKVLKIPGRVRKDAYCGIRVIHVITPKFGAFWTPEQLREIGMIAHVNGLTEAKGTPIDFDVIVQMTQKDQFTFEFHGPGK